MSQSNAVLYDWQEVSVSLGPAQQVQALRGINLQIHAGEKVAIVGPNGSGKSTLLRALNGLLPLVHGTVQTQPAVRQSMLFQRPFHLRLSAVNNIRLGLWLTGQPWPDTAAPAAEALHRVGLSAVARRNGRALSGGEQQRLALARAWAQRPQLWLLDEPTASLDPQAKKEVEALIAEFASEAGSTLVFSSHNLGQVKRLASRVLYLNAGRLLADLPVGHFFDDVMLHRVCPQALAFCKGEL
ncbi:MAG: Glutamine transport ATP-binding protein GlnQ [Pseudomonadota bacterium]|jgi:tungstate transport system ATP-binding protein